MDSVKDIEYLWKWVVDSGWASKDKIAVMGGSYGGFMTLSCITVYPDLWAAAVELYGMVNMVTFFEHTASYRAQHRAYEYGDPVKDRKLLEDISAIHKIDQIVTPLLVLHGDEDPRVPMYETEQLVSEMREASKPVEFVRFLDEVGQHFFSDLKICYDTVLHGSNGRYVVGSATQHPFSVRTHGAYYLGARLDGNPAGVADQAGQRGGLRVRPVDALGGATTDWGRIGQGKCPGHQ